MKKYTLTNIDTAISSIRTFVSRADSLSYRFMADLNSRDDLVLGIIAEYVTDQIDDLASKAEEAKLDLALATRKYERGAVSAETVDKKKKTYNTATMNLASYRQFANDNSAVLNVGATFLAGAYKSGNGKRIALIRAYAENHPTGAIDFGVLASKLDRYSKGLAVGASYNALRSEIVGMVKEEMNTIEFKGTALFKGYVPNFKAREIDFIVDYLCKRQIGRDKDGVFRFKDVSPRGLAKSMLIFKIMRLQGVKITADNMKSLAELDF